MFFVGQIFVYIYKTKWHIDSIYTSSSKIWWGQTSILVHCVVKPLAIWTFSPNLCSCNIIFTIVTTTVIMYTISGRVSIRGVVFQHFKNETHSQRTWGYLNEQNQLCIFIFLIKYLNRSLFLILKSYLWRLAL